MKAKRTFPALMGFLLIVQLVAAVIIPTPVSAVTAPTDDRKQLYDEVVKVQTIAALTNCMNHKNQDRGGDKITYADAVAGTWFQDGSMIYVGHIAGGSMNCNSIVQSVASYLGDTPIGLLCRFVPATMNGEAKCGSESQVPGIKDYNFQALDWPYRDDKGVQGDESVRYSDKYYSNVIQGAFGLKSDSFLTEPAKYYMYLEAFLDPAYCQATATSTTTEGWSSTKINVFAKKVQYVPVAGVAPVEYGEPEMQSKTYYYKPNKTSGQNTLPATSNVSAGGKGGTSLTTQIALYPTTSMIAGSSSPLSHFIVGKDYTASSGNATQTYRAGTYQIGDSDDTEQISDIDLSSRGFYGNGDLYEGDWLRMHYEFMDCAAMANSLNDSAADFGIWVQDHNVDTTTINVGDDYEDPGTATSSCVIEGVGWIICPVMDFLSMATDAMYGLVDQWLQVDVSLIKTDSATYKGWATMRDLANVGFVLVFLIIIFSQISGLGLSNYGIKRLLPKLVVVAILINISFFVTQLAVDMSNVLGVSLKNFFEDVAVFNTAEGTAANGNTFTDVSATLLTGGAALIAGAAVAAGAVAYGGIGLLIMVLLAAILAVGTTMLILAARTALVVILIVVAPLAFLAMILPNTKKWYDKWRQMFVSMLVIYPMISIMFATSEMASKILVSNEETDVMIIILGLAVATVPLFATIPMIKGSLNAIPVLGNLAQKAMKATSAPLSGAISARSKAARANFGNDVRSRVLNSSGTGRTAQSARWLAGGRARRATTDRSFASGAARSEASYIADRTLGNENASAYEKAAAVASKKKISDEEVANASALISYEGSKHPGGITGRAGEVLDDAIKKGDVVRVKAATAALTGAGTFGRNKLRSVLESNEDNISDTANGSNYNSAVSQAIRTHLLDSGMKANDNALATWAYGGDKGDIKTIEAATKIDTVSSLTLAEKASQDAVRLQAAASAGLISAGDADAILKNVTLAPNLGPERTATLQSLARTIAPTGTAEFQVVRSTTPKSDPPSGGNFNGIK